MLLWCNPHNPTGRVWTRQELVRVGRMCVDHDVTVLSDEVWGELVLEPSKTPFVGFGALTNEIAGLTERLIVLTSPSKAFNVASLDVAVAAIADPTLRRYFRQAGADTAEVTPFGYAAALGAYADNDPLVGHGEVEAWRQRLVSYLLSNRDRVEQSLMASSPLLTITRPEASYLTWIDCSEFNPKQSLFAYILAHGVALSDGEPFGNPSAVRLNFATRRDVLDEGLSRFSRAVGELHRCRT